MSKPANYVTTDHTSHTFKYFESMRDGQSGPTLCVKKTERWLCLHYVQNLSCQRLLKQPRGKEIMRSQCQKAKWKNYKLTKVLMIMAGTGNAGEGDKWVLCLLLWESWLIFFFLINSVRSRYWLELSTFILWPLYLIYNKLLCPWKKKWSWHIP